MVKERLPLLAGIASQSGLQTGQGDWFDFTPSRREAAPLPLVSRACRAVWAARGKGMVKIGKTLGIGTGLVQRVLAEQTRPFDVGVAEPYVYQ